MATTVPRQYRTGKTLSSGAHAIVKEAIHTTTRKCYACKIVAKDDLQGSAHLVGNEISILRRVHSENINIVRLHDYFETAHNIYLCLDLCTGGTLWDRITTQGVYNETKATSLVRTLFVAVKHIHEAGVLHRNLRPENLFFRTPDADAPIMIFDFQRSRMVENTPNPEADVISDLRSTPQYMAPEILLEKFHDKPVDVWALGLIAFFVTTGSTPFDRDEPEQVTEAVVTGNIPKEKWDTVSINAREFISLCLSMEPAQRPTVEDALAHNWLVPATPRFLQRSSRTSSSSRVSSLRDLRLPRFFNPSRKWRILGHTVRAFVRFTGVKHHPSSAQSDTEDATGQDSPKIHRQADFLAEQQADNFPSPVSSVVSFSDQESWLTRGSMSTAPTDEDTEPSTRDSAYASSQEYLIEFSAHRSRQTEGLSTQETTNFPSTTSSEYESVQGINTPGPDSTDSSLAATDVPISTFLIYTPDKTTHDRPAVTPEDIKFMENNFADGGIMLSAHQPTEAEAWVENHYDDRVLASARSTGLRGPIAVMLSPDVPALAIFGSILDESVLSFGETLADISGFAVMIRPIDDDPVPKFPGLDGLDEPGPTLYTMSPGSKEDDENHDSDQDEKLSDKMALGDETVTEGRVWRLRGGKGDESDREEDEIPWVSEAHRAGVWVKLWPDNKRPYDLGLRTTTRFKLQSQYPDEKKMGVQPEVIGHFTLKIKTPSKILPDRSYTSIGFLAHRQSYIIECDFLDCGFEEPDQTRKSIDQESKGTTTAFNAGYMNLHPTVGAGATYSKTRTRTVELADNKPTPRCRIFYDPGQRWNKDGKSYDSYDITTVPGKNPTNGQQHPLEAEFAMGINLLPIEDAGLPKISFITRNQVVIWISDPTLKARVRGLLVHMTTYIPNIRTRKALIVQEELDYHFATSNSPENTPPPPPSAVDALALALAMAPIEAQKSRKNSISALFTDVRRKWGANKERTLDLPLQEYISRGWDDTNETWRSVVWTNLDKDFRNIELDKASTSPAWKLRFQPSAKIPEDAELGEEVGNDTLDIDADNELYVVEEVGVAI